MSRAVVPSYRFAEGELDLAVTECRGSDNVIVDGKAIDAREMAVGAALEVELEVAVNQELLARVLPPDQVETPPIAVLIAEESDRGRLRLVHSTVEKARGTFALAEPLRFSHADVFGEITLTPVVVRARGTASAPFAGHLGALIADGEPVVVSIDSKPPDSGRFLENEYQPFSSGGIDGRILQLKEFSNLMYFLDTRKDEAILYLNSEVRSLQTIMSAPKQKRGVNQRIKDATFAAITAQVWPQLFERACAELLLRLSEPEFDVGSGAAVDDAPDWAAKTVEYIAEKLYDSRKLADCISELETELFEKKEQLYPKVDKLIEEMVDPNGAFEGLVLWKEGKA